LTGKYSKVKFKTLACIAGLHEGCVSAATKNVIELYPPDSSRFDFDDLSGACNFLKSISPKSIGESAASFMYSRRRITNKR